MIIALNQIFDVTKSMFFCVSSILKIKKLKTDYCIKTLVMQNQDFSSFYNDFLFHVNFSLHFASDHLLRNFLYRLFPARFSEFSDIFRLF